MKKLKTKRALILAISAPIVAIAAAVASISLLHAAEAVAVSSVPDIQNALRVNEHASMYLTNNLDMAGYETIITDSFKGTLDGDGWSVTSLSGPLFDTVDGGTVKNLAVQATVGMENQYVIGSLQNGAELSNIRLLAYTQAYYQADAAGAGQPERTDVISDRVKFKGLAGSVDNSRVYSVFDFGAELTGSMFGSVQNSAVSNVIVAKEDKTCAGVVVRRYITYTGVQPKLGAPLIGKLSGTNTVKNVWIEGAGAMTGAGDMAAVFGGNTSQNVKLTASDITVKNQSVTSTGGKAAAVAVNLLAGTADFSRIEADTVTINGATGASGWFANAPAQTVTVTSGRVVSSTVKTAGGSANGFAPGGLAVKYSYIANTAPSGGTPYLAGQSITSFTGCVYEDKGINLTSAGKPTGTTAKTAAQFTSGDPMGELGRAGTDDKGTWAYLIKNYPRPAVPVATYQEWDSRLLPVTNNTRRKVNATVRQWDTKNPVYGEDFSMRRSYILACAGDTLDFSGMRGAVQRHYGASEVGGTDTSENSGMTITALQGFDNFKGILDGNDKVIANAGITLICAIKDGGVSNLGMTYAGRPIYWAHWYGVLSRFADNTAFQNVFIQGDVAGSWQNGAITTHGRGLTLENCFVNGAMYCRENNSSMLVGSILINYNAASNNTPVGPFTNCYSTGAMMPQGKDINPFSSGVPTAANGCYASETKAAAIPTLSDKAKVPYDRQAVAVPNLSNPKTTQELTGAASAQSILNSSGYVYTDGLYPQLKVFADNQNPIIRANSRASAIPLPISQEKQPGSNTLLTTATISKDLNLMTALPGETKTTVKWTADKAGALSSDGTKLLGASGTAGDYILTATYTDPETGASAIKKFNVKLNKAEPLTGSISMPEPFVYGKAPDIQYVNGNSDGLGILRIYRKSECTYSEAEKRWIPNQGVKPLFSAQSLSINQGDSKNYKIPTSIPVGEQLLVQYEPSAYDVKTGVIQALSPAVKEAKDINDSSAELLVYPTAVGSSAATVTPIAGAQYMPMVKNEPRHRDFYFHRCFSMFLVEKNEDGTDKSVTELIKHGDGNDYDTVPPDAAGKYLRVVMDADRLFWEHEGTMTRDLPIIETGQLTGSVSVKADAFADGVPRVGKRLTAKYVSSGSNPEPATGTDGSWSWEYQKAGESVWTALDSKQVFLVGARGYDGSYIYVAQDMEGGKYRATYHASTLGGFKGTIQSTSTAAVLKPVDLNGAVTISVDVTPPKVNKTTFTATYVNGNSQNENSEKGTFAWGYIDKSTGGFVGFDNAQGNKYTLQAEDFGQVTVKGTYLACQYTADAEGQYTGSALRYYSDVTPDQFKPDEQATPVTETVVYKTTDSEIWVKLEEHMAYAVKESGSPTDSDWRDTNAPKSGVVEIKTENSVQYAVLEGLHRNRSYTIYKKYPARTGYVESGVSGKTATAKTQQTVLTGSIALSGAPNKNGVLTAKVTGAIADSYTVSWQYKAPGGSWSDISGSTGIAQGSGTYSFTIDYGKGLANGGTVRIALVPKADFKTAVSKESGVLTDTISIGSESDLTHIGHLCASTGHESCKFLGLSEENQKKHQYKQSADIALSKAYTPVLLTGGGYDGGNKQVSGQKNPLFSDLSNAYLKNLVFVKPVISGTDSGAAANTAQTGTLTLENLLVIEPGITATNRGGTLVGIASGTVTVKNCAVLGGSISGATAGGLIGQPAAGTVVNSYVSGSKVTGSTNSGALLGAKGTAAITNSYYDKQSVLCSQTGAGAMGTEASIAQLISSPGLTGLGASAGYTVREGYYPLPSGVSENSYGKLYSVPVKLQKEETAGGVKTMIPLTKQYADSTAIAYSVSGGGKLVDSGNALWPHTPGEMRVTVTLGALSRTAVLTVSSGEASSQSVTVKAVETGTQKVNLPTPLYDLTTGTDFFSSSSLVQDTELPGKVNTYGSGNANSKVYAALPKNGAGLHTMEFTNAAAYTNQENKTITLKAYRDAAKTLYDTVTVTIEPMETRTLDITVPVGSVEINPNTADRNTESVSGGLSVTNGGKSPVNVSLTGMSPDSGAGKVTLTVNKIDGVDWAKTRESVEEAGIGVKLENEAGKTQITERAYDPSLGSGNGEFATLGYQGKASYRMRVYHPKLAVKDASFGFTMTYRVQVSPQDAEPQSPAAS